MFFKSHLNHHNQVVVLASLNSQTKTTVTITVSRQVNAYNKRLLHQLGPKAARLSFSIMCLKIGDR